MPRALLDRVDSILGVAAPMKIKGPDKPRHGTPADSGEPELIGQLLDRLGKPTAALVRGRGFERPYVSPSTVRVIRSGASLELRTLDPSRTYLWIIDARGDFRFAPEQDPSYASLYPQRVYPQVMGRPDHGLKHADLAAGARDKPVRWILRPPARMGGELEAETGPDGLPTGRWVMNNNSAYNSRKNRLDRRRMGEKQLHIAHEMLGAVGIDTSGIILRVFQPA